MLISTPEARQPTYTVISVEKDRLTMTVKQLNGLVMDEFTILANPVSGRSRIVAAPEETGCGSTLTASAVVSSTILATAVIVIARSKDDDSEA